MEKDQRPQRPNITCNTRYHSKEHIDIKAEFNFVKERIAKYILNGTAFPGFKITDLGD